MASDKLSTYRSKRDFQKSAEPSGEKQITRSNRRRIIIQKHDATACMTICAQSSMAS
ncbi:hypothetical protein J2046_002617 [Rhizobium petrolearium]|nr:hypothetical protein [Neorhizobium petrolearium]MBP1844358.1 hypothetical protein [Neorhizobium petrolearium]